jgi:hypothetical protein
MIIELYCKHNFHTFCLAKWLKENVKCPLCKKDFRQYDEYKKYDAYYKLKIKNLT